jgi:hypothetical protein
MEALLASLASSSLIYCCFSLVDIAMELRLIDQDIKQD